MILSGKNELNYIEPEFKGHVKSKCIYLDPTIFSPCTREIVITTSLLYTVNNSLCPLNAMIGQYIGHKFHSFCMNFNFYNALRFKFYYYANMIICLNIIVTKLLFILLICSLIMPCKLLKFI